MEWSDFISGVVLASTKEGVVGLSDLIIRDNGMAYASVLGTLEFVPVPAALQVDGAFDDLLHQFAEPKKLVGRTLWEGAWSIFDMRFRLSLSFYLDGRELVMRLLPSRIPTPEEVLFPELVLEHFMKLEYGLALVLGTTGSGKSTTAAALLQHMGINHRKRFITIEDPIEYVFPKTNLLSTFTQRQVGLHCDSFASALRAALRQKPDVIMVGEIRDDETAETALKAAECGILVMATMHVDTPDAAVQRYLKMIPSDRVDAARDTLAHVLKMAVGQRLVRHPEQRKRVAIHEVLLGNEGIAHVIRHGEYHILKQNMETSRMLGMQTFAQSLEGRVGEGHLPPSLLAPQS